MKLFVAFTTNIVSDASRNGMHDSRVTLQIVASLKSYLHVSAVLHLSVYFIKVKITALKPNALA